jgi:hypothetical protein
MIPIVIMSASRDTSKQLLFQELLPKQDENAIESKLEYDKIHVSRSTFKGGLSTAVHKWFRLTPSFGPGLVTEMLSEMSVSPADVVLDPFSGAGTTLIQCQLESIRSFGFEINPFLQFVASTSLNWNLDPAVLKMHLNSIKDEFTSRDGSVLWDSLAASGLSIPLIHNPTRWWRKDVLLHLLILKAAINNQCKESAERAFFILALAGVLIPHMTNVTLGRLQLHFIDKSDVAIDVLGLFLDHSKQMIEDVAMVNKSGLKVLSNVHLVNATHLENFNALEKANIVITSPPYPNRYSYVWNTRPYLYLFDLFSTPKEASELDLKTIGGTWGTATSILQKGTIEPSFPIVGQSISVIVDEIRAQDNLMANYLIKYFNDLSLQIIQMERAIQERTKIAYVVGCSRLKGVYVETDVILAKIIEGLGLGYHIDSIRRIRKRHSGKDLHESIVYASR